MLSSSSNNAPARLRPTSGVLKHLHLDATNFSQKLGVKKEQQQHYHQQNWNQNQNQNRNQNQKRNQNENRNQNQNQKAIHQRHYTETDLHQHRYKNGYRCKQYKSYKRPTCSLKNKGLSRDDASDENHVQPENAKASSDIDSTTGAFGERKARNKHLLVPRGRTESSTSGTKERMKHPKLVGADVYVMRLARPCSEPAFRRKPQDASKQDDDPVCKNKTGTCSTSSASSSSTGSLHDELSCKEPKAAKNADPLIDKPEEIVATQLVAESRPCYRCISYMHFVGIKRVFWTTSEGKWEGAKIRDLVDHLEGAMASSDNPLGSPVFVTKHEVLLLRQLMSSD